MKLEDFWYIVAVSRQLERGAPLPIKLLGRRMVLFRDSLGEPRCVEDHCLHRGSRLSRGKVEDGRLRCPYHGWLYDAVGKVVEIPTEGAKCPDLNKCVQSFSVREDEGYLWVRLAESPEEDILPREIPMRGQKGWQHIRLRHRFKASLPLCAENFLDIPHTVFVHPGIFRNRRKQRYVVNIERHDGNVTACYKGETDNFGIFSKLLNPRKREIVHFDRFFFPNVTEVEYRIGQGIRFFIRSHCAPESMDETMVYTDLVYRFGSWGLLARPFVMLQAKWIIKQDIEVLESQAESFKEKGPTFLPMPADGIHLYIESIWNALRESKDPRRLAPQKRSVVFHA